MSATTDHLCKVLLASSCADKSAEFTGYPLKDYPELPRFTCERAYTANAAQLLTCIDRIKYAAQRRSDSRPVMSGVRFYRQLFADDCKRFCNGMALLYEMVRILHL